MNTNTWLIKHYDEQTHQTYWSGECEGIIVNTNAIEIQNTPVEFLGETRDSVIKQIQECLLNRYKVSKKVRIMPLPFVTYS